MLAAVKSQASLLQMVVCSNIHMQTVSWADKAQTDYWYIKH